MNNKRCRNGRIDFMRFVFCLVIMLHHSGYLVGKEQCHFWGGALAVEFFFIVSGYLMMTTLERTRADCPEPRFVGRETKRFLWKKIRVLYPEALIAWIIGICFVIVTSKKTLTGSIKFVIDNFWELLMANMSGLPYTKEVNYATWYISAMLICLAVLYPLIRKYPDVMAHIVIPILSLLMLGYLCGEYGHPRGPGKWIGWTLKGNIRAFADLGLGVICYQFAARIRAVRWNRIGKIALTAAEIVLYLVFILYMYMETASKRDFFFTFLLFIAIGISFSGQSLFMNAFDNKLVSFLGRFSVPLYFSHFFYAKNLGRILPHAISVKEKMIVYFLTAFATAVVVYILAYVWRKYKFTQKIIRVFVQQPESFGTG